MQHILDIHDYDDYFLEQFTKNIIPIYDLWSIRPLQNDTKELLSGNSENVDKFRDFIVEHSGKEIPYPLLIIIGNAEKANPNNFQSNKKSYYKLKFDKNITNDIGSPIVLNGYPQGKEQMQTFPFAGYGQGQQQFNNPNQGISYTEIQGIIDKNVSDASRSIKAEYTEISAKQNIENIKQMAALETKMEMYKLDLRANEIEEKERKLNDERESFEMEKSEGLGNVKDYTKTIAGGLLELGKSAFGIDDFEFKGSKGKDDKAKGEKDKETDNNTNLKGSASFDDDGFTTKKSSSNTETQLNNSNAFSDLMGVIGNLNEEEKYQLLNVLIPEEEEEPTVQVKSEKLQVKSEGNSDEPIVTSDENTEAENINDS